MREKLPPPKLAFGINEAAHSLSVGRTKIYCLINEGVLRSIKIGGRRLVCAESLHQLLKAKQPGCAND
ncbi:excisionase family DNA-binding protein [Rhodobacterales bacterium LSUCC0031]|nr:excisionase family DNA-binding protein [Rhodobacterales bacterium LSUCC0031]